MSTRRRNLKAAETHQLVIGSNEAGQAQKLGSEEEEEEDDDCETTTDFCCTNSYIPTHIVIDILSRVPIKTLLNLRLVCKDWLSLISDPDFAYLHLSKSRRGLLFEPSFTKPGLKLNFVDLHTSRSSSPCDGRTVLVTTISLPKRPNTAYSVINSCNGLLCLVDRYLGGSFCICNPLLDELVTLPNCPSGRDIRVRSYAFGFSPKTTQYKVIVSFERQTGKKTYEAEIYTLGEGSWRSMGRVPTMVNNFLFDAFLHGSLHWISHACDVDLIYSFDFGSEQFRAVPEPSEFDRPTKCCLEYIYIGVLQGCLSICDMRETGQAKVWVMKDYGVKESWSKDFVIEDLFLGRGYFFHDVPVMLLGDEHKLLIARSDNCLRVYNIASKHPRNMHTFQRNSDYFNWVFDIELKCLSSGHTFPRIPTYCIAHVPSLLSLKNVAKGECFEKLSCMKETESYSCKDGW